MCRLFDVARKKGSIAVARKLQLIGWLKSPPDRAVRAWLVGLRDLRDGAKGSGQKIERLIAAIWNVKPVGSRRVGVGGSTYAWIQGLLP